MKSFLKKMLSKLKFFQEEVFEPIENRDHIVKKEKNLYTISDIGKKRKRNEDFADVFHFNDWSVLLVADGVASTSDSDQASYLAGQFIRNYLVNLKDLDEHNMEEYLKKSVILANKKIYYLEDKESKDNAKTTIVVALISPNKKLSVAWAGDSRAYLFNKTQIMQITEDDSYVNDLKKNGFSDLEIKEFNVGHIITQCLGIDPKGINVHTTSIQNIENKNILLCSDGFWNYFETLESLIKYIHLKETKGIDFVEELINDVNNLGARDNVSVSYYENHSYKDYFEL